MEGDRQSNDAAEKSFYAIFRSILNDWSPGTDNPFSTLSERAATILLIGYLDTEVENGGFHQWLTNPTGEHTALLEQAVRRVGCAPALALVERAISDAEIVQAYFWHGEKRAGYDDAEKRLDELSQAYEGVQDDLLSAAIRFWHEGED